MLGTDTSGLQVSANKIDKPNVGTLNFSLFFIYTTNLYWNLYWKGEGRLGVSILLMEAWSAYIIASKGCQYIAGDKGAYSSC